VGESWHVVPGAIHEVKVGEPTTKVLALYVVERANHWPRDGSYNQTETTRGEPPAISGTYEKGEAEMSN
jgi:hypothetical protein